MKSLIRILNGTQLEYRELSRKDKEKLRDSVDDVGALERILKDIWQNGKRPQKTAFPSVDAYLYGSSAGIQFNYNPRDK